MAANVGARVQVFWESEDGWFTGTIQEYDAQVGYRVLYDDGDEQWETASNPDRLHFLENTGSDEHQVEAMDPPDDEQEQDDVVQAIDPPSDEESEGSYDQIAQTDDTSAKAELDTNHPSNSRTIKSAEISAVTMGLHPIELVNSVQEREQVELNTKASDTMDDNSEVHGATCSDPLESINQHDGNVRSTSDCEITCEITTSSALEKSQLKSKGDFNVHKENDVITEEMHINSAITIPVRATKKQMQLESVQAGPGTALLSGNVHYLRSELDTVYNAYVKVSFVAPGPGSVMLRCKTVLYTTPTIANSARPIWRDAVWRYSIPNDDGKPWESLRGDLLFAVFNQLENNIFIGQVVLPIQSFLSDNCPPGPQTLFDEEYSLTSRQGNLLGGIYVRLSHQLILPPAKLGLPSPMTDISENDIELLKPKKSKPEPARKNKKKHISSHYINRTKREAEIQYENESHKRRVQAAKSRQPKTQSAFNKLTAHSAINRKKELAAIDAENKRLQSRRKNIAKALDKKSASHSNDLPEDMASQVTYVIQVELTTSVALLQKEVAELEQELASNKASLSRLNISNCKDLRTLENLEKAYKRATSAPTKANANIKSTKQTKAAHDTSLPHDKSEHLALLERENASIVAERQKLMNEIRSLHSEESEAQGTISKLEAEFARVERRRAFLNNPKASSDLEQIQVQKAWNELTNLKICVAALEEKVDQNTTKQPNDIVNDNWHDKLQSRKEKEAQLKSQRDAYRQEYQDLIASKAVDNLRQQVLEMQHMLLLCEHEEKAMIAANIDAQVKVQDAAIAFQRQFQAEKTDTDVLFQVTQLQ